MKINVYGIRDVKTPTYGSIFTEASDGTAVRSLNQSIQSNPHSPLAMFPEDYQLYSLGQFDTDSGALTSDVKFVMDVSGVIDLYRRDN